MSQPQTELSRDLSLFDITMIGVGAMIGAGIFVLTGIAAGAAGPALILSFALNGIVTIFTAMVYAELGSSIPEAGGGYLWVKEGLPGPNAFLAGWMSWFAHAVAGSLYALGFGSYLTLVLSQVNLSLAGLEGEFLHKALAVLIIGVFLYINFRGSSETGLVGNIVTVLKVVVLAIFVVSGLWAIFHNPDYLNKFQNFTPNGFGGILTAMGLTFIAFEGYEIIVQAGEEVKNPRQNIPKAVFLSLVIVVPIYMLVAFVAIGAVNPETNIPTYQWLSQHAELGVAEAARQFMPFGTILLLIGGLLSTMSALNATTFSSTRVSFAMGRDKNLPNAFATVHPYTRTPHIALILSGALIIFMAVAIPIEDVAAATDIMFLLLFLQVNVAVITIRKKYGDRLNYGYLMPFFPIVPIIGIVTKLFLALFMFNYSPLAWYFAIGWIGVGTVGYYFYARPREAAKSHTPVVLEEKRVIETPIDERRYRVLVPIANPASVTSLLKPAIQAARRHNGVVTLLHVLTVPEQLPLSAGRAYLEKGKTLLNDVLKQVELEDVPAEAVIRISHWPHQAIIHTAIEKRADLLVMGWRGPRGGSETTIGSNVDQIIELVNCRVLVVQQTTEDALRKILVPIANPAQLEFALEAAELMATKNEAEINVLHVFRNTVTPAEQQNHLQKLQGHIERYQQKYPRVNGNIKLLHKIASDPIEAIVETARDQDYLVLGATRESWFKQRFFGNKPFHIAQKAGCPAVLVRPRVDYVGFGVFRLLSYLRGGYRRIDSKSEQSLQAQGILRPPSERSSSDLHTHINTGEVLLTGVLGLISCVLMYWGSGGIWTWVGAVLFLVTLAGFTYISTQGVFNQRRRT
ncbi:MAG: amino acid permease [Anaerolineae bacterium]|nr:amino acid permease [Anaerolineae bacterium]